ncbi:MAG: YggT family protein [Chloroflexi bacterium]|jgi:YggT family protein|nr:MAG: YggT family protein [Chloroflexota bacterium]
MDILILFISAIFQLLFWLVIIAVVLSYFMDPYHPVRRAIDGFVEPMLAPIRRILPPIGGLDFSPFVLLILIQVLRNIIVRLLLTLR